MEMEEEGKSVKDYLQMARRRKYFIVIPMMLGFIISVLIAFILPPVYRSEAIILIEQQHIPADVVKSTVVSFADERIQQIQQKIMTIDSINKMINQFDLYPKEKNKLTARELALLFRQSAKLELISADVMEKGRESKIILAFKLIFEHKQAALAQQVANELLTRFLVENLRSRTERAEETTLFLQLESAKLKQEIQTIENTIAEYKQKNSNSLPALLPTNVSLIDRVQVQLQQLVLQEKILNQRETSLRMQLAMSNPVAMTAQGVIPDSLPMLEAAYVTLLINYSASHPDVKAIKRKIEGFHTEREIDNDAEEPPEIITNPVYLQLSSEIKMVDTELNNVVDLRASLSEQLKTLELNVAETHQVERGYYDLLRDLDNVKAQYSELKTKYLDAKLAQTMEEEQKAETFSVQEPARLPTRPEKPNRKKLIFKGLIISIIAGFGIAYLVELMDGSIRGYEPVVQLVGEEPLVVIPYIVNDEDVARTRKNQRVFILIGVFYFVCLLTLTHVLYMPLDMLWYKVLKVAESKISQ